MILSLSLLDHFYFLQNDHDHYQMGGGCRPMEPKSTVWQPHCYLLQRQGGFDIPLLYIFPKGVVSCYVFERWKFTSGRRVTL